MFLVGLEEDVFPSSRAKDDPAQMEEERRLCYVGMTRAEKRLYLTAARSRRLYGTTLDKRFSRFLFEIPDTFKNLDDRGGEDRWGAWDGYGGGKRSYGGYNGSGGYRGRRGW